MTFPDVHLAGEAVAAFVDGELTSVAHARALAHLDQCAECRAGVRAQQEAAAMVTDEPAPAPPDTLITRLREIPMTAELDGGDVVLAVDGEELVWGTPSSMRGRSASPHRERRATQPAGSRRPQQARPSSYSAQRAVTRSRRARHVLVGAMAGLAFGVFAVTAPITAATSGAPDRDMIGGVNGGIVDPPPRSEVVANVRQTQGGSERPGFRSGPLDSARFVTYEVDSGQSAVAPVGGLPVREGSVTRSATMLRRSDSAQVLFGGLPLSGGAGLRAPTVAGSVGMR